MLPEGSIKAGVYFSTALANYKISRHHTDLIQKSIDGLANYQQYWGTLGTDFTGAIAQIALWQAAARILLPENKKFVAHKIIPLMVAAYDTIKEAEQLFGVETRYTRGDFDIADVACYWGAAITMMILPKLVEKPINAISEGLEGVLELFSGNEPTTE